MTNEEHGVERVLLRRAGAEGPRVGDRAAGLPTDGGEAPPILPDHERSHLSSPLAEYVHAQGIDAEIVAPGVPMPTVSRAAEAIGVSEEQIIKCLLFQDRATGKLVLAIASGTGRIDRNRLAAAAGLKRPSLADAATVLAATGYPAGGVPPFGHAAPLAVVVDRRAAALEIVYGGGGSENLLLRVRPADVLRLTGGIVADIVGVEDNEG